MTETTVDAQVAASAFGWSLSRLRVWRYRHPGALPVVGHGPHGVALFRWADVEHAQASVVEPQVKGEVTSEQR